MACCVVSAARSGLELRLLGGVGGGGGGDLGVELRLQGGDRLLDLGLLRVEDRELGVELVGDLLLLVFLRFEIGLLVLELRVHRRQLLHHVVVGLVRLVEQLLPADGVDGVRRSRSAPGASCPGGCTRTRRAAARTCRRSAALRLGRRDRVLRGRRCARASPRACGRTPRTRPRSRWRPARASASFWRAGVEVVVRGRAGREDGHAHARGGKSEEEEATKQGHTAGVARPGIRER